MLHITWMPNLGEYGGEGIIWGNYSLWILTLELIASALSSLQVYPKHQTVWQSLTSNPSAS